MKPTATLRDTSGAPLDRDEFAASLLGRADAARADQRSVRLCDEEADVIADLLDELAGVYEGEALGTAARLMAVMLHDRRGS